MPLSNNLLEDVQKCIRETVDFADLLVFDTCSLLHNAGPMRDPFFTILNDVLRERGKFITVPQEIMDELNILQEDAKRPEELRKSTHDARHWIKAKNAAKASNRTFRICGDGARASHADARIVSLVDAYHEANKRIVVLTQDWALATELLTLSATPPPDTVRILRVDHHGRWVPSTPKPFGHGPTITPSSLSVEGVPLHPENSRQTLKLPSGEPITLGEVLGKGGEGFVYACGAEYAVKLYKTMSEQREAKLCRMVANPPASTDYLAYPKDLVMDANSRVVGTLLPRAHGVNVQTFLRFDPSSGKPLLLKQCPHFRRHHVVEAAQSVARLVAGLHQHGVILGDINLENVLVELPETEDSPARSWLIDVDSAQIEGFPCMVEKPEFSVPWGKPEATKLKTFTDDDFALAVLLFTILMAELLPYQCRKKEYAVAHHEGLFPFFDARTRKEFLPPVSAYASLLWGSFPVTLRGRFREIFSVSGRWRQQRKMPWAETWEPLLQEYRQWLLANPIWDTFEFVGETIKTCQTCEMPFVHNTAQLLAQCPVCRKKERICKTCGKKEQTTWEGEAFYCHACRSKHKGPIMRDLF